MLTPIMIYWRMNILAKGAMVAKKFLLLPKMLFGWNLGRKWLSWRPPWSKSYRLVTQNRVWQLQFSRGFLAQSLTSIFTLLRYFSNFKNLSVVHWIAKWKLSLQLSFLSQFYAGLAWSNFASQLSFRFVYVLTFLWYSAILWLQRKNLTFLMSV